MSIANIADRLDCSSPQSFGRMIQTVTGLTGSEFRAAFDGSRMLDRFRATLIAPYRGILQGFDPFAPGLHNAGARGTERRERVAAGRAA